MSGFTAELIENLFAVKLHESRSVIENNQSSCEWFNNFTYMVSFPHKQFSPFQSYLIIVILLPESITKFHLTSVKIFVHVCKVRYSQMHFMTRGSLFTYVQRHNMQWEEIWLMRCISEFSVHSYSYGKLLHLYSTGIEIFRVYLKNSVEPNSMWSHSDGQRREG